MCNNAWIDILPHAFYQYLNQSTSDHSPMHLHMLETLAAKAKSFRYFNYWADCESFEKVVKGV